MRCGPASATTSTGTGRSSGSGPVRPTRWRGRGPLCSCTGSPSGRSGWRRGEPAAAPLALGRRWSEHAPGRRAVMEVQPTGQPKAAEAPASPLKLDREAFGKAAEVADGFWIIATRHRPGLSRKMFEINNRCLVFRLQDPQAGGPVLLVANAVDPAQSLE